MADATTLRVSVLITTHNYGGLVSGAIESVLAQTLPAAEIVVVDDGSTDDTPSVLERFGARIRIIRQRKLGQAGALSTGFLACTGDVVALLDADDRFFPTKLQECVAALHAAPAAGWCVHGAELCAADGARLGVERPEQNGVVDWRADLRAARMPRLRAATSVLVYRRAVLGEVLPLETIGGLHIGDHFLKVIAAARTPFVSLKAVLTTRLVHGANAYHGRTPDAARRASRLLGSAAAIRRRAPDIKSLAMRYATTGMKFSRLAARRTPELATALDDVSRSFSLFERLSIAGMARLGRRPPLELRERVSILGVEVDVGDENDVIERVVATAHGGTRGFIANLNLHSVAVFHRHEPLRRLYRSASHVFPDGKPVAWLGSGLTRTTYVDLWRPLFDALQSEGLKVFVVGGTREQVAKAAALFSTTHPGLRVGFNDGYFDPRSRENEAVLAKVREFSPNVILVGMGVPRQEDWILANWDRLPEAAILNAGGWLAQITGRAAPRWMGRKGLEWLWRLKHEPTRLWRRYLVEPWSLVPYLIAQLSSPPVLARAPKRVVFIDDKSAARGVRMPIDDVACVYERLSPLQLKGYAFKLRGVPWAVEVDHAYWRDAGALTRYISCLAFRGADLIVAASESLKAEIAERFGIAHELIHVAQFGPLGEEGGEQLRIDAVRRHLLAVLPPLVERSSRELDGV